MVVLHKTTGPRSEVVVEVAPPAQVFELDDLDEELAAAVLAPRWVLGMGVPGFPAEGIRLAKALARFIAEKCQGAVLDPQEGRVIWPKGKPLRFIPPAQEETISEVRLAWFLPPSKSDVKTAETLLRALGRQCPEARPVRFGGFEPLQGRLEPDEDEPFLDAWRMLRSDPLGSLFFSSRSPCFGGSVFLPHGGIKRPGKAERAEISLDFDGRAICGDERWRETLVSLFVELSKALGAFYAQGYVERGVVFSRGRIWISSSTEHYPLPGGGWWGIPSTPTWLAWFGTAYKPLVQDSLRRQEAFPYPEGIFLRLGTEPADLDQLRGVQLNLPARLLAGVVGGTITAPDGKVIGFSSYEAIPAEFVPDLGQS